VVEAIMHSSIAQLVSGMVVAVGLAVVGVSAIGGAAAFERAQAHTLEAPVGHQVEPLTETDARLGDRQQLRRLFFDDARDRLK
jgi:hypothetical protein